MHRILASRAAVAGIWLLCCWIQLGGAFVIPSGLPRSSFSSTQSQSPQLLPFGTASRLHVLAEVDEAKAAGPPDDPKQTRKVVSVKKVTLNTNIPRALRTHGSGIPSRKEKVQLLESRMYETNLIQSWDIDVSKQRGFDWEIEKMRRYFAGLRLRDDGTWVRQPSFFEFLVHRSNLTPSNNNASPQPVGLMDVVQLTVKILGRHARRRRIQYGVTRRFNDHAHCGS
jgi:hypothetical protein